MSDRPVCEASYQEYLKEKKLMGVKCKKCGALFTPPRPICTKCYSSDMEWVEMKGKGKIVAFSVIPYVTMPMVVEGYGRDNPVCAAVVELDEGTRLSAQVFGVDCAHPENIKIGTPVSVDFMQRASWHFVDDVRKVKKFFPVFRTAAK